MVFARPDERETWPYHFSLRLFTMVRRSSCGPIACWILARTSLLVPWSLLSGCPNQFLNKLHKVQNSAARLVFKARKQEHVKTFLQKLHWLPVHSRIQYRISTLCYDSFSETYPLYLSSAWTIMAFARVSTCSTETLYPSMNWDTDQIPSILNTTFGVNEPHEPMILLWTSTYEKARGAWTPNHFVTVTPRDGRQYKWHS